MNAPARVLALIFSVVSLSCGGGSGGSADKDYYIGEVNFIEASMALGGGEITIMSVSLFDIRPGGSPRAVIPPGAEDLVAEMFGNGDLADGVTASARRVAQGPDDDRYDDDEWILAEVKVDDPEQYDTAVRTPNGTVTDWVSIEDAATPGDAQP